MSSYYNWNEPPNTSNAWSPAQLFADNNYGFFYDITDKASMFQDAAATVPVTADGQPVGYIRDKSGRNYHMKQANNANRPTYREINGQPLLHFPRTANQYMITDGFCPVDNRPGVTTMVLQNLDYMVGARVLTTGPSSGGDYNQYTAKIIYQGAVNTWLQAWSTDQTPINLAGTGNMPLSLVQHEFATGNKHIMRRIGFTPNELTQAAVANVARTTGKIALGCAIVNNAPYFDGATPTYQGYMGALVHVGRAITTDEQAKFTAWLRSKYPLAAGA